MARSTGIRRGLPKTMAIRRESPRVSNRARACGDRPFPGVRFDPNDIKRILQRNVDKLDAAGQGLPSRDPVHSTRPSISDEQLSSDWWAALGKSTILSDMPGPQRVEPMDIYRHFTRPADAEVAKVLAWVDLPRPVRAQRRILADVALQLIKSGRGREKQGVVRNLIREAGINSLLIRDRLGSEIAKRLRRFPISISDLAAKVERETNPFSKFSLSPTLQIQEATKGKSFSLQPFPTESPPIFGI